MGIKQLMKLLNEEAFGCYKEVEKKSFVGRTIAIDASMQLYSFLVQIRTGGQGGGGFAQHLQTESGEVTSHLQGFWTRTISLLTKGIKPVFVFDGKPPDLKMEELGKRKAAKEKAQAELKAAEEKLKEGDKAEKEQAIADIEKAAKRTTRVTKEHNEDIQKLCKLMGLPVVLAPCEAEAQCAELCKKGKVYGIATEDMDALTFGTPILIRALTMPDSQKIPVKEIHLDKILALLDLTMDQFIDLCILCGCDYCPSIRGIGPKNALKLIREHKDLETIFKKLDKNKYNIPETMVDRLDQIRGIFKNPEVADGDTVDISYGKVDEEGVIQYLVNEKQFDETRVKSALERLKKSKSQTSQTRMDSFFKAKAPANASDKVVGFKRKDDGKGRGKGVKRGRGRGRR